MRVTREMENLVELNVWDSRKIPLNGLADFFVHPSVLDLDGFLKIIRIDGEEIMRIAYFCGCFIQ